MSILRRGPVRGVLATALAGWLLVNVPMIISWLDLKESGERSIQLFGVWFVAVIGAPISLLIALGFLPAHLAFQERGRVQPSWYIGWAMALLLVVCAYIEWANPGRLTMTSQPLRDATILTSSAAGLGIVFWLFAVRLP